MRDLTRITTDPQVMGGKPCIRGLRMTVGTIVGLIAAGPNVIQVGAQDVTPDHLGDIVVAALREHREILERGALITIDESRLRARILPLVQ